MNKSGKKASEIFRMHYCVNSLGKKSSSPSQYDSFAPVYFFKNRFDRSEFNILKHINRWLSRPRSSKGREVSCLRFPKTFRWTSSTGRPRSPYSAINMFQNKGGRLDRRKWMSTESEMSFFTERIYAMVHFKEVRSFLFIHFERTPLLPMWKMASVNNCVKILKDQGKVLRIRASTLTVQNLCMMFKLYINPGIYLSCEEEGEIIFPTDGAFNVQFYHTYFALFLTFSISL